MDQGRMDHVVRKLKFVIIFSEKPSKSVLKIQLLARNKRLFFQVKILIIFGCLTVAKI